MKKFVIFTLLLAVLAGGGYFAWKWYFQKQTTINGFALIPTDASFVIETDDPVKSWKRFSKSAMWQHVKGYEPLGSVGKTTDKLTKTIEDNDLIFSVFGKRNILISAHVISPDDYDFLFICDMQQGGKFTTAKDAIITLLKKQGFTYTQENVDEALFHRFYDPKDKSTLFLYFAANQLVCSYNHSIILASSRMATTGGLYSDTRFTEVHSETPGDGLCRIYLNHSKFSRFLDVYMDDVGDLQKIFSSLWYTGVTADLSDALLKFNGFTSLKDSTSGSLKAILQSGTAKTGAQEVLSNKTAFMLSFGFQSFPVFYENLKNVLKSDPKSWSDFEKKRKLLERLLRFSLEEDLLGWIDNEVTIAQYQQNRIIGDAIFTVAAMKAVSIEKAKEKLGKMEKRLKLLTKFKSHEYKGHEIHYMEIRGLFRLLFGKLFDKIEKPYYTYLGEYVVFCDDPATLLHTIDDFENNNTLARDEDFSKFSYSFKKVSNVFAWVNMKHYFLNMKAILDPLSFQSSYANRQYIMCFPQMGFQLSQEENNLYDTRLALSFAIPNEYDIEVTEGRPMNIEDLENLDSMDDAEAFILEYISGDIKKELYDNGKVKFLASMKDGVLHGKYLEYWENGEIKIRGRYRNGEKTGRWKYYREDGKFYHKERFGKMEDNDDSSAP